MNLRRLAVAALILILIGSLIVIYRYYWPESIESVSHKWSLSTHANTGSPAFTHWDEDDPPLIPARCAKCHSTYGYRDFLGADGSTPRQVDEDALTGTVVFCSACHNDQAHQMTSVGFPSEAVVENLDREAICMQCHQGLRSSDDVAQAIEGFPVDQVAEELGFINVHYQVAAATLFGGEVRGGYQYPDQEYVDRFEHDETAQTCIECHDPHSQQIAVEECQPCHVAVVDYGDLELIRSSDVDYDGDGSTADGIAQELESVHQLVYIAMQEYARQEIGTPLIYADQFPYFFIDSDGDGQVDEEETGFQNQYGEWTPRLVRTAYNYHFVHEDPGAYVHNGRYVLQLLYDSLADLSEVVDTPLDDLARPEKEMVQ